MTTDTSSIREHVKNIYAEIKRLSANLEQLERRVEDIDTALDRISDRFEHSAERHSLQHNEDADRVDYRDDWLQGDLDYLNERVSQLERR